jgi:hypothetical protein
MFHLQPHPLHSTATPIGLLAQLPLFISNPNFYGAAYFSWTIQDLKMEAGKASETSVTIYQ